MSTERLAADLRDCTDDMRLIVAAWMLENGWTEPLDDAGTEGVRFGEPPPPADGLRAAAQGVIEWADEVEKNASEMDYWPDERFSALRAALAAPPARPQPLDIVEDRTPRAVAGGWR